MQSKNRLKSERPRHERDFYETPYELCRDSLSRMFEDENIKDIYDVLDPGCGTGVWGKAFRNAYVTRNSQLVGVDIELPVECPKYYDQWIEQDFLNWDKSSLYNIIDFQSLVIGNPPYKLAEEFIRQSLAFTCEGGYVFFLLRLAFLESQKRYFGLFQEHPPKRVYVLSRRPSFFSTNGRRTVDSLSYAMFLFQKGWKGQSELDWLYWDYDV